MITAMTRGLVGALAIGGVTLLALAPAAQAAPASFAPAVSYGAGLARGVDTGDLDGDGKLDLIAVGSGATIRLGDGAGGLGGATSYPAGGRKISLEDFDGDARLDLGVVRGVAPAVAVALGNGLGGFGPLAAYGPSTTQSERIAAGDVNGDQIVDLAVEGPGNSASVILGTGTGAFGAPTSFATGGHATAVAFGHVDGDGHLDLAVTNSDTHTVSVMRGTGTGTFAPATSHAVGLAPRSVAIGDLDQDGNGDLAVPDSQSPGAVSILLGTGSGFVAAPAVPVGQAPRAIVIEDFNVDGTPDIAVSNVGGGVTVATGTGAGGFAPAVTYAAGTTPWDVTAGDLNADGRPDLLVANEGSQNVTVHLNTTDILPPETTITAGPAGLTNDPDAVFTFGADEPASFACSLDQGTPLYVACASGDTFSMAADGSYTFRVRATDAVGNVDATPATRELTLDTTPPDTTITSGPSGLTTDATPTFAFEADEPITFACSLDQGTPNYAACASGDTFAVADGSYTFRVRATDSAGNVEPTPAERAFSVDTIAPETTITSGPSGPTDDATPTFEFGADEPATFACSLDQGTPNYAACASGDTFTVAADGSYTFRVRATDAAGNTDPTPATRAFTLDTTPAAVFDFTGFFQPVDNLPTLNLTSPGQGVAVKFSLGGDHGLDVLAAGYPKSEQVACDSTAEVDGIESTTAAGDAGLRYDPGADTYTYVWKTQRTWAGTCRQLIVRFTDGTTHRAAFKFRR